MKIKNTLKKTEYSIFVQKAGIKSFGKKFFFNNRRVLVVTDDGVPKKYSDIIANQCNNVFRFCLAQGEKSKCLFEYDHLMNFLLDNDFNRNDCIVAVGGGVVSDLCGFVASTYKRGIMLYLVPTTLLAQIDASVGGKNAINFNGIKNILGSFYSPSGVLVDPLVLQTLDKRQLASGFVELLKMALTCDKDLFLKLEQMQPFTEFATSIIRHGIRIKKNIVEHDPFEQGWRRVLNFGHTIGHAIESAMKGKLLHGECVAIGMLAFCNNEVRQRLKIILQNWHLPTSVNIDIKEIQYYLEHDKKNYGDIFKIIYVDKVGDFEFREETIGEIIQRMERIL